MPYYKTLLAKHSSVLSDFRSRPISYAEIEKVIGLNYGIICQQILQKYSYVLLIIKLRNTYYLFSTCLPA